MSLHKHRLLIKEVCVLNEQENQSITINQYNYLLGNEPCHTRNISKAYIIISVHLIKLKNSKTPLAQLSDH